MSHQPKPAGGQRNRNRNYYSVLSDTTEQENPPQLSQGAQSVHIASSIEPQVSQPDIDSTNNSRLEPQQVQHPAGSTPSLRLHGFFTIIPRRVANTRIPPRDTTLSPSATLSPPLSNYLTVSDGLQATPTYQSTHLALGRLTKATTPPHLSAHLDLGGNTQAIPQAQSLLLLRPPSGQPKSRQSTTHTPISPAAENYPTWRSTPLNKPVSATRVPPTAQFHIFSPPLRTYARASPTPWSFPAPTVRSPAASQASKRTPPAPSPAVARTASCSSRTSTQEQHN